MTEQRTKPQHIVASKMSVLAIQLGIIAVALLAWQYLPKIGGLQAISPVFDPYFVSSPSEVFVRMGELMSGSDGQPLIWSFAQQTIVSSLVGCFIGIVLGTASGLILSMSPFLARVARPFVIAFNAMPRVALIPIIVVVVGPTVTSSVIASVMVVFFVVFFNAFEGATQVPDEVIRNVRILGATRVQQTVRVRLPYVMGWVSAAIPNAVAFSLIAVVTAEILVGSGGIGRLLLNSVSAVDPTLTFSVVIFLSVVGIILVVGADYIRARVLHWW